MGFVGNLLLFAAAKEFCKSIKNCQSYRLAMVRVAQFFESQSTYVHVERTCR